MFALPTIIILFLMGPLILGGFVAGLVLPTLYIALRSKIRDPEGLPKKADPGTAPGS